MLSEARIREIDTAQPIAPEAEDELSLLGLLITLARRRGLIAGMALMMAIAGFAVSKLLPNRFTAYTAILPPQQGSSTGAALLAQLNGTAAGAVLAGEGVGFRNSNDLQVALLRSWTVEDAMVERFHLISVYHARSLSEARYKFEKAVDIDSGAKDGLIRIYVIDRDPHRAADMANAYVEEFRKATADLAISEASRRRVFFEQQLEQARDNLANAEEDLKRTEQKTGLLQPDAQTIAVIQSVAQLRAQIAAQEVQIQAMRSFETSENPDLQLAQQQLDALKAQQAKLGSGADGAGLLVPKGNMQQLDLDYVRKLRDVKYYEAIFDLLARQLEAAKVDEARQGTMIQVVDRARTPEFRSSPKPARIIVGMTALGIFLGIVWALAAEGLARLSRNPLERSRLETLQQLLSFRRGRYKYRHIGL